MHDVSILLAFSAGVLSFLSPCVLPLIPGYIGYLTGSSVDELKKSPTRLRTIYKAIGFVVGFSLVFIFMGLSMTYIGRIIITNKDIFRKIGGILIIVFGIHTLGIIKIRFFYKEKRLFHLINGKGPFSSIVMGIAFAAGWTPCVGPILSSILIYAANTDSMTKGGLLLVMYSMGMAIPFLLTAYMIESITSKIRKFSKYLPVISIISGLLMIIMGIMIFFNKLAIISQYTSFFNL